MAISIDWPSKVISIAKADMILIQSTPVEIYQLNLQSLHEILRDLEGTGFDVSGFEGATKDAIMRLIAMQAN